MTEKAAQAVKLSPEERAQRLLDFGGYEGPELDAIVVEIRAAVSEALLEAARWHEEQAELVRPASWLWHSVRVVADQHRQAAAHFRAEAAK